ncbi:chitin synthase chs-2-like [Carassius gibelio]|uniref:chitin synthase chs-2-like n=1 Tax=Carassius gibelio TaxID=101364 RepID=UPI002279897D|nr:chitin synthase chs-2-like [Carassius gibelio]
MEELKQRGRKREGRHRDTWDPFQLNPIGAEKEKKRTLFRILQNLVSVIVGLLVLFSGVMSKGSLLVLTTLTSPVSLRNNVDKQFYTLILMCVLVMPNLLMFLKSMWKCVFKSYVAPNPRTLGIMCVIESLVAVGTAILVLIVMPKLDVLTNLCIPGGICILSAVFQIAFRLQTRSWMILYPICSLILVLSGYVLLAVDYYVRESSYVPGQVEGTYIYVAIAIFATLLISLNWWENPFQASTNIQEMLSELDTFRDSIYLFTSLIRIALTMGVYFLYYCLIVEADARIKWDSFTKASKGTVEIGIGLFCLQAFCSAACHWFGVVACKIHSMTFAFALPVSLTGPVTLILGMILFLTQAESLVSSSQTASLYTTGDNFTVKTPFWPFCHELETLKDVNTTPVVMLEISYSICKTSLNNPNAMWPFSMLALEGVCMWLGLVSCTYYVWKIKVQRIERTSQLFVRRLYESAFIDLSMLLNTKMKAVRTANKESSGNDHVENCVIYLCATMWHETYDEMLKIMTSMFRLDRYRGDPKEEHKDCFDFECHIYVDDGFMYETDTDTKLVNSYVCDLIQVVMEVYRVFTNKEPDEVSIIETPYGGRLVVVMPEGNMLYIHLKDKKLIRHKKRWSQIMYLYYLLGWKGYNVKNPQKITRQNNPSRASLISLDGESYLLPSYDNDSKRRHISDDNTYIMALDGDTDFHPAALILLVDRLRMYDTVGAACGRIHPTGMGPMVWYQKFEYAVGHWLQKTAEHVFGSVLCSPGCFSLFRGSALMDDNVLKRYTTKATRASEYVQYDQGEDRWLCTLLLQQGWRVEYNAASDAFTNSPQEFKEFYNQRRRWGPSTLANTLDLLHSGKDTVKRNTSISILYILYQTFTVASSILGPASVTLMVAGAFQFVFGIEGTLSIIIAVVPPTVYMIICFVAKPNFQITIAAILSVIYAFLMTASFFSIIGDMVKQGTFITPTGLFLVSGAILYMVTAILHPQECTLIIYGLMYFICIPSGYLLLTIYSLVNMHIVSWGTRETNKAKEQKKQVGIVCNRDCKMCCWDVKIQVTQETENLVLQQIQQAVNPNTPAAKIEPEEPKPETTNEVEDSLDQNKHILDYNEEMPQKKDNSKENLNKDNEEKDSCSDKSGSSKSCEKKADPFNDDTDYEEDDDDDDDYDYNDYDTLEPKEFVPESDWVEPVKKEFLKKLTYANLKRNLQEQIRYTLRNKNQEDLCEELVSILSDTLNEELRDKVGPEDVLSVSQLEELQYALNEAARRIVKSNRIENGAQRLERRVKRAIERTLVAPQVEKLTEDEHDFWNKLIERYLLPIQDDKAHLDEVTRELKSLRNKAVFLYFIINVLWIVATFFLQAIGTDVLSINIPKYYPNGTEASEPLRVEPLSLMFLLSFALLLIIQFLAMLYHRVYTLIHVVSYRSTEKDYKERDEEDEDEGLILGNPVNLTVTSDDL